MPHQQHAPRKIGLPPFLISFTMLLPRPMAAIAMMIKNLLSSFNGAKKDAGAPKRRAMVVITEARMNHNMNIGKDFFRLKPLELLPADLLLLARIRASTKVIGMMARVRSALRLLLYPASESQDSTYCPR